MKDNKILPDDVEDEMNQQTKFMDEFIKKGMEHIYWLGFRNGLEIFKDTKVKELSNTTEEPGNWIDTDKDEEWAGDTKECPFCGRRTLDFGNFCSNCGHKMNSAFGSDSDNVHKF